MRERAISAAVLVPVLLIVLAIGGPAIALAIALITVVAAIEVFRLLHSAGHDAFPALGIVLAVTIVLDAAFPDVLDGSGLRRRSHRLSYCLRIRRLCHRSA